MKSYLLVAIGSAVGGLARFALGNWLQRHLDSTMPRAGEMSFPIGTLVVNTTGSLLIGAILVIVGHQIQSGDTLRWLLAIGFCGGYTTFSTFSADTVILVENGGYGLAALNVGASLALAFAATFAGMLIARAAIGRVV